jgi:hypothetical protein
MEGVFEKRLRHTGAAMLTQHQSGKRWREILGMLGLCLACATWLYFAEQPPLLLGLALTVGCAASFGRALWLTCSWRPGVGIIAMLILPAAAVGLYWWQGSASVLDLPKWPIPHLPPGVVPTIRR